MDTSDDQGASTANPSPPTIDLVVRVGSIVLLAYWTFRVVEPLAAILLWSVIIAAALYPLFDWLAARLGSMPAATLVTCLCFLVVIGPITWLGLGMITGIQALVAAPDAALPVIPLPSDSVKNWPIIGGQLHRLWTLAANNAMSALTEIAPLFKPLGFKLLALAQNALLGFLELLVAILIAGFLFARGPQLADALTIFLSRVLSHRGKELVQICGATIRNVSRGVVGISMLQALLAGASFIAFDIPAAAALSFLTLLLGITQIGPSFLFVPLVLWSWSAMDPAYAAIFSLYMIPVGLLDNILKPLLMARGLSTPMPVIMVGVIGGTLAFGIVGLFFGPIVLSVAWAVMENWVQRDHST
jgi:predicted PurR-regulated permease PerM